MRLLWTGSSFLLIIILALMTLVLFTAPVAAAEHSAKQVYRVITPVDAPIVRVIPEVGKAIVVPGSYGQWGFVRWDVEPEAPAGTVTLRVLYYADPDCAALTLLYIEGTDGTQLPMYGFRIPSGNDKSVHSLSFTVNSPKGVRAIVLKRGDAGEVSTVPIMGIELSHQEPQPDPRIRAYRELLARPALAGVTRSLPRQWIEEAEKTSLAMDTQKAGELTAKVEKWLAAESHYACLADQVEYLVRAAKVLKTQEKQMTALSHPLITARRQLNFGESDQAEMGLTRIDSSIDLMDRAVGGGASVLPQKQPVIVTWNRNWALAGFAEEPTPLTIKWQGGVTLKLEEDIPDTIVGGGMAVKSRGEYAKDFTVRRSWTGCVWEGRDFVMTSSVLTPLVLIDEISANRTFTVSGALQKDGVKIYDKRTGDRKHPQRLVNLSNDPIPDSQAITIETWNGDILIIPLTGILQLAGGRITCGKGDSFAVVGLPTIAADDNRGTRTAAAVRFWSRVAAAAPVGCVQTYDDGKLSLRYIYRKPTPSESAKPLKIAPVPPLAMLAEKSGWKLGLTSVTKMPAKWPKDQFAYVPGTGFSYTLPPMKSTNLRGINIGLATATQEKLKELADLGATSVRLLVMKEDVESKLAERLKWCKQVGIKATIDQHFGAYYDPNPGDQAKLIELWEQIARACQTDRDAVKAYDFKNEPMEDAKVYLPWAQKCVDAIRKIDPVTPILVEAPNMANPNGFEGMKPLKGNNLIYGVHVYVPHGFTHGRIYGTPLFGSPDNSPARFYPGWVTPIDWSKSSETWFNGGFEWWDRWELQATCLPVYEFLIKNRLPLDVGEFGVVGYLMRDITIPTSQMWLKDAIDMFESWGASWDVWSYEYGYTWYPGGKELIEQKWRELNKRK